MHEDRELDDFYRELWDEDEAHHTAVIVEDDDEDADDEQLLSGQGGFRRIDDL